jgi:alpha-D-ribose 1-methylphosphonate 5-triphosphate diphosphatase
LSPGKRADLFVTDGNDRVVLTLCAGEIVHHNGTLDLTAAAAPAIA